MEEIELHAYTLNRLRFVLAPDGLPEVVGFRRVFFTPVERSEEELERVAIVLECFLDTSPANVYTEEDGSNDQED